MKFELTTEMKQIGITKLFRIKALISFGDVTIGDIGGYIEKEKNLSQTGEAWVYDNAQVYGEAQVYDNARVYGEAVVYDHARVYGEAWVCDNAWVYGEARVSGKARVSGNCINIQGRWNITIMDEHIRIGCELHTIKQWFSYGDSIISKMEPSALDWWLRNRKWLKLLCETRAD